MRAILFIVLLVLVFYAGTFYEANNLRGVAGILGSVVAVSVLGGRKTLEFLNKVLDNANR